MTGLLLVVRPAVAGGIEFVGVLHTPSECFVALQPAPATSPAWVRVGDRFDDCTVREFDPERNVVVLVNDARRIELSLRGAHVVSAAPMPATDRPESGPPRAMQLAIRAAYQRLYLTGMTEVLGNELASVGRPETDLSDYADWRFRLTPSGELAVEDRERRSRSDDSAGPIYILVAPETALPQVAARLHYPLETLGRLNPDFAHAEGGGLRTVRVR